ncbi:hypothetical protein [Streptomyces colonosanans]|uniref:hypothetical protein n=1 Tax=Streptomyces colonosanans TaxID=1428652 RepID=UPI0026816BE4
MGHRSQGHDHPLHGFGQVRQCRRVLYLGRKFTVHKASGNWHYIKDITSEVKGWVPGTYVCRDTRMRLD